MVQLGGQLAGSLLDEVTHASLEHVRAVATSCEKTHPGLKVVGQASAGRLLAGLLAAALLSLTPPPRPSLIRSSAAPCRRGSRAARIWRLSARVNWK